jgi:hypothetical protein
LNSKGVTRWILVEEFNKGVVIDALQQGGGGELVGQLPGNRCLADSDSAFHGDVTSLQWLL